MAYIAYKSKKDLGKDPNYYNSDFTTPESLVKDLLKLVSYSNKDFIIDAGSGERKVWFSNIKFTKKEELELKDGKNFLDYNKKVDWVIENPPFTDFIKFIFKLAEICNKGFAFLTNHSRINQLTPRRLEKLKEKGFYITKIHVCSIKKWFGRYYFLVFTKNKSENFSWSNINYD